MKCGLVAFVVRLDLCILGEEDYRDKVVFIISYIGTCTINILFTNYNLDLT